MQNADQIEYWNGPVGELWAAEQARIDALMINITARLLPFAEVRAGESVLDVGCGCGTTSLELARMGAKVTGIDISAPMLAVARARASAAGLEIGFTTADAGTEVFAPEYDLLFSRFGVMFFADPVAAFANLKRALKPGGRVRFVCWRALGENDWVRVPLMAGKPFLPETAPPDPTAPGPFAFADKARLTAILGGAGYSGISIEAFDTAAMLGPDTQSAASNALEIGPLSRAINAAGLDDTIRTQIKSAVGAALRPYLRADGVWLGAACWLVGATA